MSGLNKVMLIGRLGKDPEIRNFPDGGMAASFSLATSETYKGPDGAKVEHTEWHNVVTRGKLAEIAQKYLAKGRQVFIEGKIKTRSWESDGVRKYISEIITENLTLLEPRDPDPYRLGRPANENAGLAEGSSTGAAGDHSGNQPDEDPEVLPF